MREVYTFRRTLTVVLSALLVLAAMSASAVPAAAQAGDRATLVVTGRAEIKAEPDMAVFTAGVETRGETVEEARAANAETMAAIRSSLLGLGADERQLQTRNLRVSPEWHYNPSDGTRTLIGYVVTHSLEVTVTDLTMLGPWIDAAVQAGANQLSGPTFGLSNSEELEARALTEAVRKARTKAEVLARAAGVFLRQVVHISENVNTPMGGALRAMAVADAMMEFAPTPVSPGEVSVTATVTMTFEI